MSKWTNDNIAQMRGETRQLNERLRVKDKEELVQEVIDLKKYQNIQGEEIKLLKAELVKMKKKPMM